MLPMDGCTSNVGGPSRAKLVNARLIFLSQRLMLLKNLVA